MSTFGASCLVFSDLIQESRTLDLANDCHRFVAAYFEIIRASSPHIYHSALALAPKMSIVRKLYEPHSHPLGRIVHGVSELWDSNASAATSPFSVGQAAWSPCNSFIAICPWDTIRVDILDSVTLQRLQTFGPLEGLAQPLALIFSPERCMLTYSGREAHRHAHDALSTTMDKKVLIITWDIQTGGVVSTIEWETQVGVSSEKTHITYSMDGKMVAILCRGNRGAIFNVVSGVYMHDVDCRQLDGSSLCHIWTHGESIRFATAGPSGIAIWEVGFTLGDKFGEVKVISVLDDVNSGEGFGFLPASDQDPCPNPLITFLSDNSIFACSNTRSVIYLWKKLPTSYIFDRIPKPHEEVLLSPSGKSFIIFYGTSIRLWHMNSFTTAPSSTSVQPERVRGFVLDFLLDRSLAVVVYQSENTVTLLDLSSGVPWYTIKAPLKIYGLRMKKNAIAVIGCNEIITWNIPEDNSLLGVSLDIGDSTQTVHLSGGPESWDRKDPNNVAMSPDFCHIAFIRDRKFGFEYEGCMDLEVYHASTGKYLDSTTTSLVATLWFSSSGDDIWYANESRAEMWTITGDRLVHKMAIGDFEHGPQKCPWKSSCGYQITYDGWVLSPGGKHLMMLPPHWQLGRRCRMWNGKFLALLHPTLPEPVVIEVET